MGSKWINYRLEEISLGFSMGPFGSNIKKENFIDGGVPVIRGKNMNFYRYVDGEYVYLSDSKADELHRSNCFPGDLVFTHRGTIGQVCIIPKGKFKRYVVSQSGMRATIDLKQANSLFILYFFKSHFGQHELLQNKSQVGVPAIANPLKSLRAVRLFLPSLTEQRAIAHILGSLDDKIELNRRMNETLEAMAQALFQSWFVDFDPVIDKALAAGKAIPEELEERAERRRALGDRRRSLPADVESLFPDEFEHTDEMGWVPKGWKVGTYIDVTDSIFSGGTPDTRKEEYWNGPFSWFSSGETREAFITESEKNITSLGIKNSSTKLAKPGDTLIASAGQGHTRGQTSFCSIETYFNQSVVCLRPLKSDNSYWLFFSLYRRYDEFRTVSDSHSIRGSLTTRLISSLEILMPSSRSIKIFSSTVSGFTDKIISNKREIHHLSGIRDTLLPKLISGELRIPDAEKMVEKVL